MAQDSRQAGSTASSFSALRAAHPCVSLLQPSPPSLEMIYAGGECFQELDGVAVPEMMAERIYSAMEKVRLEQEALVQVILDRDDQWLFVRGICSSKG